MTHEISREEMETIIEQIASAETENMAELAKIAGVDICRDFAGSDLSGTDLSGLNLRGADFEETDFEGANLSHADLSGANLTGANLTSANLDWANFSDANLTNANFSNASVLNIVLINANCEGVVGLSTSVASTAAKLSHTKEPPITLVSNSISNSGLIEGMYVGGDVAVNWKVGETKNSSNNPVFAVNTALNIEINSSDYTRKKLVVFLKNIRKALSIIRHGTLKLIYYKVDYKKENIQLLFKGYPEDIAELHHLINSKKLTQIKGYNITEIQQTTGEEEAKISLIQRIKTGEKNLSGADLSGADLSGADLSGADLSGADLSGADLRGANMRGSDLIEANLEGSDLRGANMRGSDLSRANLQGSDLNGANLEGTNLEGVNLEGVNLRGFDLKGTRLEGANRREAKWQEKIIMVKGLTSQKNVKYRHNQTLTITKNTIQFGNHIYQFCNVTGFGIGEVESKFPLKFVALLFLSGLALTQAPTIGFVGVIAMVLAVGLVIAKFVEPKQYGLTVQLNSGITEFFITSDLKKLREIIHHIYMMMEKSLDWSITFYVSDNLVRIEGSLHSFLDRGTIGGDLSSNVSGSISKNP